MKMITIKTNQKKKNKKTKIKIKFFSGINNEINNNNIVAV